MSDNTGSVKWGWFLAGLAVGVAVGLLIAPQYVRDTRYSIARKDREFYERGKESAGEAADLLEREVAERVADTPEPSLSEVLSDITETGPGNQQSPEKGNT